MPQKTCLIAQIPASIERGNRPKSVGIPFLCVTPIRLPRVAAVPAWRNRSHTRGANCIQSLQQVQGRTTFHRRPNEANVGRVHDSSE